MSEPDASDPADASGSTESGATDVASDADPGGGVGLSERTGRRPFPWWGAVLLAVGGALLLAAAVGWFTGRGSDDALPPVDWDFAEGREPLHGFGEVGVTVTTADGDEELWCMLLAETAAQRSRGLMEVTDPELGGYDGMLFVFDQSHSGGFWMRNTPMPLTIAYLDEAGTVVSTADMEPCGDSVDCRSYRPAGPYRMALEVPRGALGRLGIGPGSTLVAQGPCAPADP